MARQSVLLAQRTSVAERERDARLESRRSAASAAEALQRQLES